MGRRRFRVGYPVACMQSPGESVTSPADRPEPAERASATTIRDLCPYLAADAGRWRSRSVASEHRCGALEPPAVLAPEKQRRLCLTPAHAECATYRAAVALAPGAPVPEAAGTRWAFTQPTPVSFDHGRVPRAARLLSPGRRAGQFGLGGLMVVAFAAVAVARFATPSPQPASAVDPTATPAPTATPTARLATPSPGPTSSPTPTPTSTAAPTAVPTPTPVPTTGPTPLTYVVRSGDTLIAIAGRFGTSVRSIMDLNGISDPSRLRIGQVLQIPVTSG